MSEHTAAAAAPPLCPRCAHRPCECKVPGEKTEEEKEYWRRTAADGPAISKRLGSAAAYNRRHRGPRGGER